MYFPYFRGKQYELITVRECAGVLAASQFVPIVEPVKESLGGLERALEAVNEAQGSAILVVNPIHGDHANDNAEIESLLNEQFSESQNISAGILLTENVTVEEASALWQKHQDRPVTLIHAGFNEAKKLTAKLGDKLPDFRHVFVGELCGDLYPEHFKDAQRVLLKDGFKRRTNKDYPDEELFSDLHITFQKNEEFSGFGDFLIVGNEFRESGGPAYAVAIHLTYINPDKDSAMYVHHFKSIRQDTPTDPAGKFAEALEGLVERVTDPETMVFRSEALSEFLSLHERGHFPGLGYIKKLSMKHHIETLAHFFKIQHQ